MEFEMQEAHGKLVSSEDQALTQTDDDKRTECNAFKLPELTRSSLHRDISHNNPYEDTWKVLNSEVAHEDIGNKVPKMFDEDCLYSDQYFGAKFEAHEGKLVGFYTQKERRNKLAHLRAKLLKRKLECPVNKTYKGRSKAARRKPRFWGKFVKSEVADLYAVDDREIFKRNALIDKYVTKMDYQKAVEVLAEY